MLISRNSHGRPTTGATSRTFDFGAVNVDMGSSKSIIDVLGETVRNCCSRRLKIVDDPTECGSALCGERDRDGGRDLAYCLKMQVLGNGTLIAKC